MFFNASTCTVEGNAHLARCLMRMPLGAWASRPRPAYRVIIIIAGEKYAFSTGRERDAHAPIGIRIGSWLYAHAHSGAALTIFVSFVKSSFAALCIFQYRKSTLFLRVFVFNNIKLCISVPLCLQTIPVAGLYTPYSADSVTGVTVGCHRGDRVITVVR